MPPLGNGRELDLLANSPTQYIVQCTDPHVDQTLASEVTGRNKPSANLLVITDDALIPQQGYVVSGGQDIPLELIDHLEPFSLSDDVRWPIRPE
jgi:hypothetical protein